MAKKKFSAKQLAAQRRFARIMKSGGFKKRKHKTGAVKLIERGETRSTRPDRIVRVSRKSGGQFKKFKQVGSATIPTLDGSMGNVYWKKVREQKLTFIERASSFITIDNRLINWEYRERFEAIRWLSKHKSLFKK